MSVAIGGRFDLIISTNVVSGLIAPLMEIFLVIVLGLVILRQLIVPEETHTSDATCDKIQSAIHSEYVLIFRRRMHALELLGGCHRLLSPARRELAE
jgi:hypothetical protein